MRALLWPPERVEESWERVLYLTEMLSRFAFDLRNRPEVLKYKLFPKRSHMAETYGVDPNSPAIYPLYLRRLAAIPFRLKA